MHINNQHKLAILHKYSTMNKKKNPTSDFKELIHMISDRFNMTKEENIFQAKRILVDSIYQEANLEGIAVTFADTEDIINNVNVNSISPKDISKVFCLRDGWNYLFENIDKPLNLVFLEELHEIVARFDVDYKYLGKPRTEDVLISGTNWRPSVPNIDEFVKELEAFREIKCVTELALRVGVFLMRTQLFKDGNKRIGSFVTNKILIEKGRGIFNVPVEKNRYFKELLVNYYESNNPDKLVDWMYNNCLFGVNEIEQSLAGKLTSMVDVAKSKSKKESDQGDVRNKYCL